MGSRRGPPEPSPAPQPTRAGRARLLLIAAWLVGCGGGGAVIQHEIELHLRGDALPAERQLIRVPHGDEIKLHWTTDRSVSVHLHGYDIEERLTPGTTTTMWFVASATGRFPITSHADGGDEEPTLAYLEVHAR